MDDRSLSSAFRVEGELKLHLRTTQTKTSRGPGRSSPEVEVGMCHLDGQPPGASRGDEHRAGNTQMSCNGRHVVAEAALRRVDVGDGQRPCSTGWIQFRISPAPPVRWHTPSLLTSEWGQPPARRQRSLRCAHLLGLRLPAALLRSCSFDGFQVRTHHIGCSGASRSARIMPWPFCTSALSSFSASSTTSVYLVAVFGNGPMRLWPHRTHAASRHLADAHLGSGVDIIRHLHHLDGG